MIINKTTCHIQSISTHPNDNWMGDEWALVPAQLQTKALQYAPYCKLVWFDGELVDIVDNGTRPPVPEPEPSPEELINLMLGGDLNE